MLDLEALGAGLGELVLDAVERATAPLLARIAALEAREAIPREEIERMAKEAAEGREVIATPYQLTAEDYALIRATVAEAVDALPAPEKGDRGEDGRDAEPVTDDQVFAAVIRALEPREGVLNPIAVQVGRWFDLNPPPAGADGKDGESVTLDDVSPIVREAVSAAVSALPAPKDGKDGASVTTEDLAPMVQAMVAEAVAALPPAKDGRDGVDGKNGRDGIDGKDGRDGLGQAGAVIDRDGILIVTMTDGTQRELGIVVGRDGKDGEPGKPGKDGRDGLEPDRIELCWSDDGRTPMFKFHYGDTAMCIEAEGHPGGFLVDRGVFAAETEYLKGDGVTWGGSYWIAQEKTSSKPGTDATWRLAVRKGRDGKGEKGDPGPKGDKGDPGVDRRG